jgi:biotin carboxyl carrier protein
VSIAHAGLALKAMIRPNIDVPRDDAAHHHSGNAIEAPLHGVVSRLHVALGDTVEKGTPVLQMEAMKLIHTLKAPVHGRVDKIRCAEGDTVPAGAILVEIAPAEIEEKA